MCCQYQHELISFDFLRFQTYCWHLVANDKLFSIVLVTLLVPVLSNFLFVLVFWLMSLMRTIKRSLMSLTGITNRRTTTMTRSRRWLRVTTHPGNGYIGMFQRTQQCLLHRDNGVEWSVVSDMLCSFEGYGHRHRQPISSMGTTDPCALDTCCDVRYMLQCVLYRTDGLNPSIRVSVM